MEKKPYLVTVTTVYRASYLISAESAAEARKKLDSMIAEDEIDPERNAYDGMYYSTHAANRAEIEEFGTPINEEG